ncbi:MAG: aminoacyl-tRNA hydrolase [Gammaproteobacteria bacterium]|nr:aminoacyl-tRNA hydrolase [Gammaproteobacteria bacterium]
MAPQFAQVESGLLLVVGLGNPGSKYEATRHNAGFWFLDTLARRLNATFRTQSKFHGEFADVDYEGRKLFLLKPTTYMNDSGRAVSAVAQFYKVPAANILVAHDELDLPPGTARLKNSGGHGGHNGLRDIISAVNSKDFWRLRIGIGHPGDKNLVLDYVLKNASKADQQAINHAMDKAVDLQSDILSGRLEHAMHQLHS